ncbi:MAG: hypothetical protein AAGN66_02495 [Acidobacteriota bacterium]
MKTLTLSLLSLGLCMAFAPAAFAQTDCSDPAQMFDCFCLTPGSPFWHEEGCGNLPDPGTTNVGMNDIAFDMLEDYCRNAPTYTHPIQIIIQLYNDGIIDLEMFNELSGTIDRMGLENDPLRWAAINWAALGIDDPSNADFWQWFDTCVAVGYIPVGFPGRPAQPQNPQ